jgi:hypothetical protein
MIARWISQGLPRNGDPVSDLFRTSTGAIITKAHLISRLHGLVDELGFGPGLACTPFAGSNRGFEDLANGSVMKPIVVF